MKSVPQRRYPGLNYFKETQRSQFFGRDDEMEELYSLILTEKIVTLFGKSGYGKSSLLRAGILPQLGPDVTPVVVQLGAYQPGLSLSPIARTLEQLNIAVPEDAFEADLLTDIKAESTLWYHFKKKQRTDRKQFLLVFDQFEEFDSYPVAQRIAFKQQLAELLYTRIPQAVRDYTDTLPDTKRAMIAKPLEVKAVFAIREDRLSVLDSLADKLPAILHKRFKLQGLTHQQALSAIIGPAALPQTNKFISPDFSYTTAALEAILEGLEKKNAHLHTSSEPQGGTLRLEAFLLQICCESIESGVMELSNTGKKDILIGTADLPPFERLFEEYYRSKIAALPANDQDAARRMIEDELVKADPVTGIAYRMSADGRQLRALPGINEGLLKRLTDDFLLRSEPNTTGDFNYEVSHDTLVEGIIKSKKEYETGLALAAAERQAREETERLRIETELQERKLAEEHRKLILARRRTVGAVLLALVALAASVLAFRQSRFAQQETKRVEQGRLTAYANDLAYKSQTALRTGDRNTAFRLAEFAHRYIDADNPNVVQALIDALYYNDAPTHTTLPRSANLVGHLSNVWAVAYSPDGKLIATGSDDNTAKIWDLETGKTLQTLTGHTSSVLNLVFSPDGQKLVTTSDDRTARIWDVASGKSLMTLYGHKSTIRAIACAPDGKTLATGSDDKTAKIWDWKSGRLLMTLAGHASDVWSVAYSPDGQYLATGSDDYNSIVWDLNTGKPLKILAGMSSVSSICFSPDGKTVATGSFDNTAKIWDWKKGKVLASLEGHTSIVRSVTYSKDGKHIATGSDDNTARLWDLETGKPSMIFVGHTAMVRSVTLSPDSKKLATASFDNTVRIWNIESGKELTTLDGHSASIRSVAYAPDGKSLATGSFDNTVKIWDTEAGKVIMTFADHASAVRSVAYSPDGRRIAAGYSDNAVVIWDLEQKDEWMTLEGHSAAILSLAYSPDGKKLATGSEDNSVKIWDLESGTELITLKDHHASVLSVAFAPDGRTLATGSDDNTVKIWAVASGTLLMTLASQTSSVRSVAFSPDGIKLAAGYFDNTIKIWNTRSGLQTMELAGHTSSIRVVAYSPDGRQLATGSDDKTVKIWNLETGKEIVTLDVKQTGDTLGSVLSLAYAPDGKKIAVGYDNNTAYIWDIQTAAALVTLQGHTKWISNATHSPDGTRLATGLSDKTAKIWDVETSKALMTLVGHTSNVISVVYAPNGKRLATGSEDNTAKIWDAETGKVLLTLSGHRSSITSVAFSFDGARLATGSDDNTTKIWEITGDALLQRWKEGGEQSCLSLTQLQQYNLEDLLSQLPDNEEKLIATQEVWQIKAFADLADIQASGSNVLAKVEPFFARSSRLYVAALALRDEPLIRKNYAGMLRRWAAVYKTEGQDIKAWELQLKADEIDKTVRTAQQALELERNIRLRTQYEFAVEQSEAQYRMSPDYAIRAELVSNINSKGWYQLLTGQFAAAEITIRRGLELDDNDLYLHSNLAPALLLQGKIHAAMQEFENSKARDSERWKNNLSLPPYRDVVLNNLNALETAAAVPAERQSVVTGMRLLWWY